MFALHRARARRFLEGALFLTEILVFFCSLKRTTPDEPGRYKIRKRLLAVCSIGIVKVLLINVMLSCRSLCGEKNQEVLLYGSNNNGAYRLTFSYFVFIRVLIACATLQCCI